MPFDCVDTVRELFVPEHKVDEVRQETETMHQLEVSKLDVQWIQVCLSLCFISLILDEAPNTWRIKNVNPFELY